MHWQTARREIKLDRPLVMGILNVTPDSFSDGGKYSSLDAVFAHAEQMIADGADIIDIGGESTRPGSLPVPAEVEIHRVVPAIELLAGKFDVPISIDTHKPAVADAAIDSGAEIINDISGLRWDPAIADVAVHTSAGLILMHSRGSFETIHSQEPVQDIVSEIRTSVKRSITVAKHHGVSDDQIAVDIGFGFGKTFEQNCELLVKLDEIVSHFAGYPLLVGTSRKSFVGRLLADIPVDQRLGGSLTTALLAVQKGARIVRAHDVKETVQALRVLVSLAAVV